MQNPVVFLCAIYWTTFDNVREGLYKNFNKLENKILRDSRVKLISNFLLLVILSTSFYRLKWEKLYTYKNAVKE